MEDKQVARTMAYMGAGFVVFCVSAIMLARVIVY